MSEPYTHQPILLAEIVEGLAIQPDGVYVDATFGRGGHAKAVWQQLNEHGRLLVIDKDPQAIDAAHALFQGDSRCIVAQGSFTQLQQLAEQHRLMGKVNGILLDLGVSSPQLDDPLRGFSFLRDGPLDMRMDSQTGISAAEWLETVKESELMDVLKVYGEERFARRIAAAIVRERAVQPITTTHQLSEIVSAANPAWEKHKHPATRSFQAIRIFINNELNELHDCLTQCLDVLAEGGRLLVMSFHSLEDRIVKRFMRDQARGMVHPVGLPIQDSQLGRRLHRVSRAIKPTLEEMKQNPRARSAVLRIGEKLA